METTVNDSEYWTYCGIKIPKRITEVPCIDNVNTRYSDGSETEEWADEQPLTLEEYQKQHSIVGNDGELYWNE